MGNSISCQCNDGADEAPPAFDKAPAAADAPRRRPLEDIFYDPKYGEVSSAQRKKQVFSPAACRRACCCFAAEC